MRMKDELRYQSNSSWSYVTRVESDLSAQTDNLRNYLQPLVMFGVFLVAVSILAVAMAVLFQTQGQGRSHRITVASSRGTEIVIRGPVGRNCGNRMGRIGGWLAILPTLSQWNAATKDWLAILPALS